MAALLYRLGAFGARRATSVLLGWLVILGALAGLAVLAPGSFEDSDSIPGSPAQTALTRMDAAFPSPQVQTAQVLYEAPEGQTLDEAGRRDAIGSALASVADVPGVTRVSDPFESGAVSPDGRTAVADVVFATPEGDDVPVATLDGVEAAGSALDDIGLDVVHGGGAFEESHPPVGPMELVGLGVALTILVITFGSLVAAGLPLLTAVLGVAATVTAMLAVANVVGISDSAPTLAIMLGLAVGIDYALFIVSRHRTQLAAGMPVRESIATAAATAGSAVVFAGATVVIALAGLMVAGVPMLTSMGLATAGSVAIAVLMALTLLPALLGLAGTRLVPAPGSRAARRAAPSAPRAMGERWISLVMRHPWRTLAGGTLAVVLMALPATQLTLALTDDGSTAEGTGTRMAYDRIDDAFGPGANGPLVVLVEGDTPADVQATARTTAAALEQVDGIAGLSEVETSEDGTAARLQVTPTSGPRTQETSTLVTELRSVLVPIEESTGQYVAVTGATAVSIDVSSKLSGAVVPFALVVVGLSVLLLMVAFRSVAIPVKATIGFLLSVGAALGATVAVFQWGWFSGVLGVPSEGPIASFQPIIVMAVLFGLAMDYEVFLVSAMREDYLHHCDPRRAIVVGARSAARVVTAAALIMVAVFVGFLFSRDPDIMPIAFALGFGVLVDAFVVRMTLVPAALVLLGDRAWSMPAWLDRWVPHLDVEGGGGHPGAPSDEAERDERLERV